MIEICSNEGIEWSFIPPHAPHFGELWKSGVRSMKHHLKRVLGATPLTYEYFYTLLVQVESTLNSRPISPLSNDPEDVVPLTPSHFLVGQSTILVSTFTINAPTPVVTLEQRIRLRTPTKMQMEANSRPTEGRHPSPHQRR